MKTFFPVCVLVLLTTGYFVIVAGSTSQLPERVAMHFGADGKANGWATRAQAAEFFETLMVVPAIFLGLALLMRAMPNGAFNLPNRDYWLAPGRRAQTVAAISNQLIWMGCLMVLFFTGIFFVTVQANRTTSKHLPMHFFLPLLGVFLTATIVWMFLFVRRFYKRPA
jgi:uncharacterized membrane protein